MASFKRANLLNESHNLINRGPVLNLDWRRLLIGVFLLDLDGDGAFGSKISLGNHTFQMLAGGCATTQKDKTFEDRN